MPFFSACAELKREDCRREILFACGSAGLRFGQQIKKKSE
ncbi:hypothetical protein HOLDEFILI_04218 [Holdemania filiformis DSM 12042]|uniref:Uncharacterized protein n=1 Tax=Holdemania filiformis DSM 12042 TaxID=545696 RepID=B9YEE4_9FIRM|nr:hypothetical protein HOLDEFILI_04218 [Holdemania filiformis DSM 12042]